MQGHSEGQAIFEIANKKTPVQQFFTIFAPTNDAWQSTVPDDDSMEFCRLVEVYCPLLFLFCYHQWAQHPRIICGVNHQACLAAEPLISARFLFPSLNLIPTVSDHLKFVNSNSAEKVRVYLKRYDTVFSADPSATMSMCADHL
jgi:hypothetical protein